MKQYLQATHDYCMNVFVQSAYCHVHKAINYSLKIHNVNNGYLTKNKRIFYEFGIYIALFDISNTSCLLLE